MRFISVPYIAVLLVTGSSGCISSAAGYHEATREVKTRTGAIVHPSAVDDEDTSKAVEELFSRPLTDESAVRLALLRNAEVQAAFNSVGVARGALVAAVRLPNPRLDGALRFRAGGQTDIELGASVSLTELILLPLREGSASSELDAASLHAAGTIMDIALEARSAYYDYVAAAQSFELQKSVLVAADAGAELAKKLFDAGNTPRLDQLNERALYEEARVELAEAEAARTLARERFNAALGLWGEEGTKWTAGERLADPPEKDISLNSVERRAIAWSWPLRSFVIALPRNPQISLECRRSCQSSMQVLRPSEMPKAGA
jgi:outer membrane protein TolC